MKARFSMDRRELLKGIVPVILSGSTLSLYSSSSWDDVLMVSLELDDNEVDTTEDDINRMIADLKSHVKQFSGRDIPCVVTSKCKLHVHATGDSSVENYLIEK